MTSPPHDLHTFMKQVSDEMASEYGRIYAKSVQDPGTAGDEGENNWATLLRDWLPQNYHIRTKGRLIGFDGTMSPQIDVVVLKPEYPRKLLTRRTWLAAGVAAVFECKTTLRAEHIRASALRCREFKKLFPIGLGNPRAELLSPLTYGILSHSHAWKSKRSKPADKISNILLDALGGIEKPSECIDFVCVSDLGTWNTTHMLRYEAGFNPLNKEKLQEIFGGEWGAVTSIVCSAIGGTKHNNDIGLSQSPAFSPIGALIALLTNRLGWNDPSVRALADYYRKVNLLGTGSGPGNFWPPSIYSNEVRSRLESNNTGNGELWSDWNIIIL
jgi:Domain of unknown function (DUF6602)